MNLFRIIHLWSSSLVALRAFSRGHCYSYPALSHGEKHSSKVAELWSVQSLEKEGLCSLGFQLGGCYQLSYKSYKNICSVLFI